MVYDPTLNPITPQQVAQPQIPDYLKPSPMTGMGGAAGATNGASNMVKALMAGNDQFNAQKKMAANPVTGAAPMAPPMMPKMSMPMPAPSPPPMTPTPPVDPSAMEGAAQMEAQKLIQAQQQMPGMGMAGQAVPQALMSPIPGQ